MKKKLIDSIVSIVMAIIGSVFNYFTTLFFLNAYWRDIATLFIFLFIIFIFKFMKGANEEEIEKTKKEVEKIVEREENYGLLAFE